MINYGKLHRRLPTSEGGFTLIELLVVIGIIALLISILLPVLSKARQASLSTQCLSNMRNIANAEAIYQSENRGLATIVLDPDLKELMNMQNGFYNFDLCPAMVQDGSTVAVGSAASLTNTYGWNEWFYFMGNSFPPRLLVRPSKVMDGSQTVMLADVRQANATGIVSNGNDIDIADPYRLAEQGNYSITPKRPNFQGRHNGSGSVLWMDGHASSEQPTRVPNSATISPGNGNAVQNTPAFYAKFNIGYLTPTGVDWTTMSPEYNFVFRKDLLSQNNVFLYNYVYLDSTAGKPAWQ